MRRGCPSSGRALPSKGAFRQGDCPTYGGGIEGRLRPVALFSRRGGPGSWFRRLKGWAAQGSGVDSARIMGTNGLETPEGAGRHSRGRGRPRGKCVDDKNKQNPVKTAAAFPFRHPDGSLNRAQTISFSLSIQGLPPLAYYWTARPPGRGGLKTVFSHPYKTSELPSSGPPSGK